MKSSTPKSRRFEVLNAVTSVVSQSRQIWFELETIVVHNEVSYKMTMCQHPPSCNILFLSSILNVNCRFLWLWSLVEVSKFFHALTLKSGSILFNWKLSVVIYLRHSPNPQPLEFPLLSQIRNASTLRIKICFISRFYFDMKLVQDLEVTQESKWLIHSNILLPDDSPLKSDWQTNIARDAAKSKVYYFWLLLGLCSK